MAVADVTAVTFIDCYGLGFLVRCTQSARDSGQRSVLRGITAPVERVLRLAGPAGTVVQTAEPTTAQVDILRACGLAPPPRITTLTPA